MNSIKKLLVLALACAVPWAALAQEEEEESSEFSNRLLDAKNRAKKEYDK